MEREHPAGRWSCDKRREIHMKGLETWNSGVLNRSGNQLQSLGVVQFLLLNPDILRSSIFCEFTI